MKNSTQWIVSVALVQLLLFYAVAAGVNYPVLSPSTIYRAAGVTSYEYTVWIGYYGLWDLNFKTAIFLRYVLLVVTCGYMVVAAWKNVARLLKLTLLQAFILASFHIYSGLAVPIAHKAILVAQAAVWALVLLHWHLARRYKTGQIPGDEFTFANCQKN